MTMRKGIQSIEFSKTPYIKGWASVAGQKEGEGPLGNAILILDRKAGSLLKDVL